MQQTEQRKCNIYNSNIIIQCKCYVMRYAMQGDSQVSAHDPWAQTIYKK